MVESPHAGVKVKRRLCVSRLRILKRVPRPVLGAMRLAAARSMGIDNPFTDD
jgi:hypothetical protein